MSYTASINTTLYGVDYLSGASVDVTDWNRAQLVQCLGTGMISLDGGGGVDMAAELIAVHRADPAPHPAYDDIQSLTLLFENGLI